MREKAGKYGRYLSCKGYPECDDINWLVTVLYGDTLLRCALKVKRDAVPDDCAEYPMEPENRKAIHALLPLHVQTCGPIVEVEDLFEVHITDNAAAHIRAAKGKTT